MDNFFSIQPKLTSWLAKWKLDKLKGNPYSQYIIIVSMLHKQGWFAAFQALFFLFFLIFGLWYAGI